MRMKNDMKMKETYGAEVSTEQSGLYVLKHKDLDVAMVQMDRVTGRIEYLLAIYLPDELPVGVSENGKSIAGWWESRAIPDTRRGL